MLTIDMQDTNRRAMTALNYASFLDDRHYLSFVASGNYGGACAAPAVGEKPRSCWMNSAKCWN